MSLTIYYMAVPKKKISIRNKKLSYNKNKFLKFNLNNKLKISEFTNINEGIYLNKFEKKFSIILPIK